MDPAEQLLSFEGRIASCLERIETDLARFGTILHDLEGHFDRWATEGIPLKATILTISGSYVAPVPDKLPPELRQAVENSQPKGKAP